MLIAPADQGPISHRWHVRPHGDSKQSPNITTVGTADATLVLTESVLAKSVIEILDGPVGRPVETPYFVQSK
jgi:hypothetical protein